VAWVRVRSDANYAGEQLMDEMDHIRRSVASGSEWAEVATDNTELV
jgi:hypothetical protein